MCYAGRFPSGGRLGFWPGRLVKEIGHRACRFAWARPVDSFGARHKGDTGAGCLVGHLGDFWRFLFCKRRRGNLRGRRRLDALREWSSDCEIGRSFRRRILGCLRLLEYRFGVLSEMHISDNTPIFLWKILRIFFSSFSGKSSARVRAFPLRWWEYDCGSLERRECVLGFVCQARDSLELGAWSRELVT